MGIDLKSLTPHAVSKDLSGYITYLYGAGGTGKTTFGAAMPKPLLLAFEKGYNALPGVYAQDVKTWGEMKQVLRQLKDPEIQGMFKTIVIDTVDLASACCEKYVCNQLGIENIGDGGWSTNGWAKVKREWESTFQDITMQGYAVLFISHAKDKTFKRKDGTEYNQIVPSCSSAYNEIIKNMVDIMGYIEIVDGSRKLVLRSADDSIACKSRFKYIAPEIDFSYSSLVAALNEAIDKEAAETNNQFITSKREAYVEQVEYDYTALMDEFQGLVGVLMNKSPDTYGPKITKIIEKYLGRGKKIAETTPEQAEFVYLIVQEVKEL